MRKVKEFAQRRSKVFLYTFVLTLLFTTSAAWARTKVKPGINLFSEKQDVEMGREASVEAEKQLQILNDASVTNYVNEIGRKLTRVAGGPAFPYQFKVVNAAEINAFALPGGFIYVNRGLIEAAQSEAELAGVIGHEIGHVVARHGTNQVSKRLLTTAPVALLGNLSGNQSGWQAVLAKYGIPLGLTATFTKFSRNAETQADLLGVQMLADSGYEPYAMVDFFQRLQEMRKNRPAILDKWFSDHPQPEKRAERTAEEIKTLQVARHPVRDTPPFQSAKARLKSLPPPPKPPAPPRP